MNTKCWMWMAKLIDTVKFIIFLSISEQNFDITYSQELMLCSTLERYFSLQWSHYDNCWTPNSGINVNQFDLGRYDQAVTVFDNSDADVDCRAYVANSGNSNNSHCPTSCNKSTDWEFLNMFNWKYCSIIHVMWISCNTPVKILRQTEPETEFFSGSSLNFS